MKNKKNAKKVKTEFGKNNERHSVIKNLSGIISLPADFDYKKAHSEYIENKHR